MQNYNTQNRIAHIMVRDGVCYECAYWEDLIAYPPEYMEVVNHKCLRLHPVADKKDKTLILGGKGKMRYFMRTDGSRKVFPLMLSLKDFKLTSLLES